MSMAKRFHPEWQQPAVVRRHIIRSNVPGAKKTATGVHYDQLFLRGGPPTFLTAWVPVGDVTPEQGGLLYLEDSVPLGRQMENHFTELCRQKGMTDGDKLSAFNENVSTLPESLSGKLTIIARCSTTECYLSTLMYLQRLKALVENGW